MRLYIESTATENCDEFEYDYPEEMAAILNHLNKKGTLLASGPTVQRLYREFSNEHYSAGWISVSPAILAEFAYWLAHIDL